MTWENGRQLASMSGNGKSLSFLYDADGMRTSKTVDGSTTEYLYSGTQLVGQKSGQTILEFLYDAAGNLYAVLYSTNGGSSYTTCYYLLNLQGDVVALTNSSGTVIARYTYDPWGKVTAVTNASGTAITSATDIANLNPLRYRGYTYDTESGLYYLQTRYYDPDTGKFINADSPEFALLGAVSIRDGNLFSYAGNNPINCLDADGKLIDIIWDVASLAFSVVDVVCNPDDPWAWIGLAGDLVDLVPFVTCVGEAARAASITVEVVDTVDGVYDATKAYDNVHDAVKAYDTVDEVLESTSKAMCFIAGTPVLTVAGAVPIENIEAGDLVWAWDETTNKTALKEVVETYTNETDELVHVFVGGQEIIATPSHPFYSPVKGWTEAVHLRAGDILVLVNGEYVVVEKVQHEILETPVKVYNFQVKNYHTYYVSATGILVHNSCTMPENFSPSGAGRHGAFNQAKRDLGIPTSAQPVVLPNVDRRGNVVFGKVYDFNGIQIRDDVNGHTFNDGGYLLPHFNTPDGRHYFY